MIHQLMTNFFYRIFNVQETKAEQECRPRTQNCRRIERAVSSCATEEGSQHQQETHIDC